VAVQKVVIHSYKRSDVTLASDPSLKMHFKGRLIASPAPENNISVVQYCSLEVSHFDLFRYV
jgi:hypothetical protein